MVQIATASYGFSRDGNYKPTFGVFTRRHAFHPQIVAKRRVADILAEQGIYKETPALKAAHLESLKRHYGGIQNAFAQQFRIKGIPNRGLLRWAHWNHRPCNTEAPGQASSLPAACSDRFSGLHGARFNGWNPFLGREFGSLGDERLEERDRLVFKEIRPMSSKYKCMGVSGTSVALPNDLATLENKVFAKVARSESKVESRINNLAVEFKRIRWMAGTLLALSTVILLRVFLR